MSDTQFNELEAIKAWEIETSKAVLYQQDSTCFYRDWVNGARWQFSQMQSQLEANDKELARFTSEPVCIALMKACQRNEEYLTALEAKDAEIAELKHERDNFVNQQHVEIEALESANARIKELEFHVNTLRESQSGLNRELEAEREKNQKLEAKLKAVEEWVNDYQKPVPKLQAILSEQIP